MQATCITEGMLIAAARSLAHLAREEVVEEVEQAYGNERFSFGPEYLLPKPIDPRLLVHESAAVAQQAIREGVARLPVEEAVHREKLSIRLGTGTEMLRGLIMKARQKKMQVLFSEGANETILRACAILIDEGIAEPVLLGSESDIREAIERLDLDLDGIRVIDPLHSVRLESYVDEYFSMQHRRGVMRGEAEKRLRRTDYFGAMMLHAGAADMLFAGVSTHYAQSLKTILEVIGPASGIHRISSHHMLLLPKNVYFLADCAVNINPTAEELAEIARLTAGRVRALGIKPRAAMLSFSDFGSVHHPYAQKVCQATKIARAQSPGL